MRASSVVLPQSLLLLPARLLAFCRHPYAFCHLPADGRHVGASGDGLVDLHLNVNIHTISARTPTTGPGIQ